jgi:FtsZ-binding cell division protein ZapB
VAEKVFNEDPYTPEMAERFASAPPPEENPLLNNATVRGDEPQRETSMFKVLDEQYNKILTELRLLTSSIEDLKQKKRKLTEESSSKSTTRGRSIWRKSIKDPKTSLFQISLIWIDLDFFFQSLFFLFFLDTHTK